MDVWLVFAVLLRFRTRRIIVACVVTAAVVIFLASRA